MSRTTFTDTQGRTWTVIITVDTVRRVRARTEVDLMSVLGGDLLERLAADPVLLCDVLWAVLAPEAQASQVTDEDFGRSLAGDAIDQATTALLEALVAFFPQPRRQVLATALATLGRWQQVATDAALARLAGGAMDAALAERLGTSSGAAPASSASTPPD